jgi:pimeloyl-ACP methyl ester carboxylesterase
MKGELVGNARGRHRAKRTPKAVPVAGAVGVAAVASAATVGLMPTLSASPELLGTVWYVRGTNIGNNPSDADFEKFVGRMLDGSNVDPPGPDMKVDYPGGFWPASSGNLSDPTFDQSVAQGVGSLNGKPVQDGDVIFGFSQGAVVASEYKGEHPDTNVTFVLVENPDRPNGGILERFDGVSIPILGVSFNGATPPSGPDGPHTVDISRQYDGWSDFPTYPLNLLATANAIAGIAYLHGVTQSEVTADQLTQAQSSGPMYYQDDTATNTEYYLIRTDELPLLMPLNGIVPKPILDALDPPLRVLVELGYDRTDYGKPTPAGIVPSVNPVTVATELVDATTQGIAKGLSETGVSTSSGSSANASQPQLTAASKLKTPESSSSAPDVTDVLPNSTGQTTPQPPEVNPSPLARAAIAHNDETAHRTTTPRPSRSSVKTPSPTDVTTNPTTGLRKLFAPRKHKHTNDQPNDNS